MGGMRNEYTNIVGQSEWKRPFGKRRRRWYFTIRMNFREIVWEAADWIHLA
jgi:hypothetical protein